MLLTALVIALLATLAGFAGRLWWPLDLLSHFRLQYLAVFLILCIALVIAKHWPAAFIAIIGLLINGYEVGRLSIKHSPVTAQHPALKLMHFNAWDIRNRDPAALARYLNTANFDLVFIQESSAEIVEHIKTLSVDYKLIEPIDTYIHDQTVVFARRSVEPTLQITSAATRQWDYAVEVHIKWNDQHIALLSPHITAPGLPGTHAAREVEFASVADWANSQTNPCIVIGDLNATPWSMHFRWLLAQTNLMNSQQGFGFQGSWPRRTPHSLSWLFTIPIDHCLHSNSLITLDRRVGPNLGSDHLPIELSLAVRPMK
jgi:endonuclease/exonuclease/phosphatase (EEP) superfamily protein YafD